MTMTVLVAANSIVHTADGQTLQPNAFGWITLPNLIPLRGMLDTGQAVQLRQLPTVPTTGRPTANLAAGMMLFDSTLGKPIWRNAANSAWVDATGATV